MRWLFILTTVGTILLSPCKITQAQEAQTLPTAPIETRAAAYPNRIEITVKISAHEDLKIAQDMTIAKGQIISDRIPEKKRLLAQKKQLELSLKRVLATSIQAPPKPLPVPTVAPLPPVNYLEQEAAIERANIEIALSQEEITIKEQEIEELSQIPDLDPIILEHEQEKLKRLQLNHQIAQSELELARGKLETAKQQREYQEYQFSVTAARRVEEQNQAKSFYQQQLAQYNEKLADREIQITQFNEKLANVQNQIDNLQIVSPYAGEVRSIDFLGQDAEGLITVKILLKISITQELPK
ncbi:hypothetical protein Xen7305DRAFT_00031770 [Xenococcus sp. PCC 7305]|uniref:hypothetical protein n=1 Tax=Xenococcus sp. PCC 7305 TaxID=102125 RepID=UPI0002AC8FAC|nr:hypothetical protein [Xenococcus sp. PCC 7305]ELS03453.1 hypothetical protein Xen7305DRAFT_00031770 [Xenococcus sp. PCC 7305]